MDINRAIMSAAERLRDRGRREFTGIELAHEIFDDDMDAGWVGFGGHYRVVAHLVEEGYLRRRWERARVRRRERAPSRRLYSIGRQWTGNGRSHRAGAGTPSLQRNRQEQSSAPVSRPPSVADPLSPGRRPIRVQRTGSRWRVSPLRGKRWALRRAAPVSRA